MTREEAERECERRAREDPERLTHTWLSKELPSGTWASSKSTSHPPPRETSPRPGQTNGRQPPTTRARRQPATAASTAAP